MILRLRSDLMSTQIFKLLFYNTSISQQPGAPGPGAKLEPSNHGEGGFYFSFFCTIMFVSTAATNVQALYERLLRTKTDAQVFIYSFLFCWICMLIVFCLGFFRQKKRVISQRLQIWSPNLGKFKLRKQKFSR